MMPIWQFLHLPLHMEDSLADEKINHQQHNWPNYYWASPNKGHDMLYIVWGTEIKLNEKEFKKKQM